MADEDIEFLKKHQEHQQAYYEFLDEVGELGSDETTPDGERCAQLAEANGLDGSVFRQPVTENSLLQELWQARKRYETIPIIIAKIEESVEASTPSFVLTRNHLAILTYLASQCIPRSQQDIATDVDLSRGTIGTRVRELRKQALTETHGERGGERITDAGREAIKDIDLPKY